MNQRDEGKTGLREMAESAFDDPRSIRAGLLLLRYDRRDGEGNDFRIGQWGADGELMGLAANFLRHLLENAARHNPSAARHNAETVKKIMDRFLIGELGIEP